MPPEASSLLQALRAAETGVAQCPNVAGYGPSFGGGQASNESERAPYNPYDCDDKPAHKDDEDKSGSGVESGIAGPSVPRAQMWIGRAVSHSKGKTQGTTSTARFVPPLPGRRTPHVASDAKADAPPPYSPST